jgi:glycosyltransferase involved in cell wall biosynthesis
MKVLVISMQSLTAVNRCSYQKLSVFFDVELYVPRKLKLLGGRFKTNDNTVSQGYKLSEFDLNIFNPLIYISFGLLRKIYKMRKMLKCIVCDFEPGTVLALLIRVFCVIYKIKVVHIAIDDQSYRLYWKDIFFNPKFLIRNFVKRLFFILMSSRYCFVRACGPKSIANYKSLGFRAEFMPLGYSSDLFFYQAKSRGPDLRVGMLGRIVKEKGAHILIEAIGSSSLNNFVLVIDDFTEYGDSYKDELIALIHKYDLLPKVEFVSPNHNEMGDLIRTLDVVIMPSVSSGEWQEQYGRIGVEAMACGLPVIASNCGSLPFILNDFGLIFPEGSVSSLRELLNQLPNYIENFSATEATNFAFDNYSDVRQAELLREIIGGGYK